MLIRSLGTSFCRPWPWPWPWPGCWLPFAASAGEPAASTVAPAAPATAPRIRPRRLAPFLSSDSRRAASPSYPKHMCCLLPGFLGGFWGCLGWTGRAGLRLRRTRGDPAPPRLGSAGRLEDDLVGAGETRLGAGVGVLRDEDGRQVVRRRVVALGHRGGQRAGAARSRGLRVTVGVVAQHVGHGDPAAVDGLVVGDPDLVRHGVAEAERL